LFWLARRRAQSKSRTLLFDDLRKRERTKALDERALQAFRTSWEMAIERVRYVEGSLDVLSAFMDCDALLKQVGRLEEQFPCEPDYDFASAWNQRRGASSTKQEEFEDGLRARGLCRLLRNA
jgi:hypothetical protein